MTHKQATFIGVRWALAAAIALALLAPPVRAAGPLFPTGSRLGLTPPAGMTPSKTFPGFVDTEQKAAIVVTALPAGAYAEVEKTFAADALNKQGIKVEKREALQLGIGHALLIVATQIAPDKTPYRKWLLLAAAHDLTAVVSVQVPETAKAYSDSTVRAALASLALRPSVPDAELLMLLPFTIGDLAGFHVANVIPGRALLLIDAPENPHLVVTENLPEYQFDARCTIVAGPGGPPSNDARSNFARSAFDAIGGIKDVQITMAEPVRFDNQEGFETVAHAKDAGTGANVMVVQWLRFGSGRFLQMVAISRAAVWDSELSRLRSVRDSIVLR